MRFHFASQIQVLLITLTKCININYRLDNLSRRFCFNVTFPIEWLKKLNGKNI